ncbi:Ribosomal RNA small subunit methyltransferase B [Roseovarius albus]|uniref:Ribosomal RNA small subunit methyltransferase B n=1 Tax=Roseovarius albus TaxID=1247867 RepID=A0A1X7A0J4_9RHOB|nr:transcription antitermination factor NusB [Roseovarius albus]SLN66462.1 Ribosomal RNA small subunit methyltransferase B [Roseovarius albus]
MTSSRPSARRSAVYLLDQIIGEGRLMSEIANERTFKGLNASERATAQRLATETLRGLDRADRLLNRQLRKPPALHVMNTLRLGTVELCTGGDAHGVVSELVGLVSRNPRYGKQKGLVNAVLRKMAGDAGKPWKDLRIPRMPGWLRDPLVQGYGNGVINAIEKVHFAGARLDLTAKSDAQAVAKATGGTLLPSGSIRLDDAGQVSALPGFEAGDWWVQDAAAALPAQILNPQKGEKILDPCAAPGGKTMQLAAAGADVTALDVSERRLERVQENLARTGLTATLIAGDALEHEGAYDAILLDAPCSATGTIRRHPDLPYAKDGSEFGELIGLQSAMLDHALTLLKPGGRLVYCTCSLLPDEGECQIEELLERTPNLKVDQDALALAGIDPAWITEEGGLRLRPDYWADHGGMDGFYIACIHT